jgi:uncharacterized cupredoxin-like copper-binding protein
MDRRWLLATLALFALMFSGCTDGETDGANETVDDDLNNPAGAEPIPFSATVTFTGIYGAPAGNTYTADITAPQGSSLTVTFDNQDENQVVTHDWYLEVLDVGTDVIAAGESTSITFLVDLEPGQYLYYCTIGDGSHRENGMEGTLTVTAA